MSAAGLRAACEIPRLRQILPPGSQGVGNEENSNNLRVLPPDGEPKPFFKSEALALWATFSPDGHWVAYAGYQTGGWEVYVRPYPGPDPATRVSRNGGKAPAWSADGRDLYLMAQDSAGPVLMAADVSTDPDVRVQRVRPFIDRWPYVWTQPVRSYDVLPDGSFVAIEKDDAHDPLLVSRVAREIHVVLNFAEELKRRERE